jgi:hypothetical protein
MKCGKIGPWMGKESAQQERANRATETIGKTNTSFFIVAANAQNKKNKTVSNVHLCFPTSGLLAGCTTPVE